MDFSTSSTLQDIQKFILNPKKHLPLLPYVLHKSIMEKIHGKGENFFEKDWDNLIILDACRYDVFEEECHLEGDLKLINSLGSWSWEFLQKNTHGNRYYDTVYVTANPYAPRISPETFHSIHTLYDLWDENLKTIPPKSVRKEAEKLAARFQNKRLVIHFMQPHTPFIGDFGTSLYDGVDAEGIRYIRDDNSRQSIGDGRSEGSHAYDLVENDSSVAKSDIEVAYRENLRKVLEEVSILSDRLDGKTVITSDHGELLGERILPGGSELYGHPKGVYSVKLREVPWFIIPADDRRVIKSEPPTSKLDINESEVKNKLRAWGYVE